MHFPWMGVIFWVGMFAWFSVVAWTRFLRERERQQTLRAFAASGKPLDAETLEKLFPAHAWPQHMQPARPNALSAARGLVVAGIVVLFVGAGILIGAQLIGRLEPDALYGMSAGGVIVSCIGLGLLTASVVMRRMFQSDMARPADRDNVAR